MKSFSASVSLVFLSASLVFGASGGVVSGTVKGLDGAPFKGAFVRARNAETKITTSVVSNTRGLYRIQDLAPGEYTVRVEAVGYKSDPRTGVNVTDGGSLSLDFPLQKGMVRWSDISYYQGRMLLPPGKGREVALERYDLCMACHGFESRMATTRRDEAGWKRAVDFMRDPKSGMGYFLRPNQFTDQMAADATAYLTSVFGVDSDLPRSPADLPKYKETVRPFSEEGTKLVYVDYELPGPNRMPWDAAPGKDGYVYMPYYGRGNQIGRLDSKTGKVEEFPVPNVGPAGLHSAVPAPDGTVWFTEQATNKIGKWDPQTKTITEYQAPAPGGKHTIRFDSQGNIWTSGSPITRYDPKTGTFTPFREAGYAYGIAIDRNDIVYFAEFRENGKLGRLDPKTGKVTKWDTPTPDARPRRIQVDSHGIVWFGEYQAGKMGRFDPKTETIKEFPLPGPSPTPYALGIDKYDRIWYSSEAMDVLGCLDPKTGKVVEYPTPYPENAMRDIFLDAEGRIWFSSPPNNRVGYFIPPPVN